MPDNTQPFKLPTLADATAARASGPPPGVTPAIDPVSLFGSPGVYPGGVRAPQAPVPASGLFDDGTQTGPAPAVPGKAATATDVAAAPAPNAQVAPPGTAAAALHAAGHTADTHVTGESHPTTHTLEHFVAMNRHLTPRDLQALSAFLPPQLAPHDQILHDVHQGFQGQRDKALQEADAAQRAGTMTPAQTAAAKARAATDYIEAIKPFAANPYAQYGALGAFAANAGGMPPAR